jgi:hypothetical protein
VLDGVDKRIGLNVNHSKLNKFRSNDDETFRTISQTLKELSESARPYVRNEHWIIPKRLFKHFKGREMEVELIERKLATRTSKDNQRQSVYVITGMGGLGKSELALQIANKLRYRYASRFISLYTTNCTAASGVYFGSTLVRTILLPKTFRELETDCQTTSPRTEK